MASHNPSQVKVAYLLLVHRDPVLLERTISALSSDDAGFFVHIDAKTDRAVFPTTAGDHVVFCEPRIPVYWGEFSQVDATLLLLREALYASPHYDYFVFLQGGTYPIRSARYIEQFLATNRGAEFINAAPMPAPGYPLSKINTVRYPSSKPLRRLVSRALAKVGLAQRDHRRYLSDLRPHAGHACWALTRAACQHLVGFTLANPDVAEYFRNTFAPDESYLHTVFANSPFRERARKTFVYADWSTSEGHHPLTLNDEHVSYFASSDKVWIDDEWGPGEMLFARKFSDQRMELIDRVDEMIRHKEAAPTQARAAATVA